MPVTRSLHHVALRCADPARSVAFYSALGFRASHEWALPEYRITRAVMMVAPDGATAIELFDPGADVPMQGTPAASGEAVRTGALLHLCLYADDPDAAVSAAVAAGGTPVIAAEDLSLGEPPLHIRTAIVEGPNGEVIELLRPVEWP